MSSAVKSTDWYLVSSHGTVLFYIAFHPDCTVSELTQALSLTSRTVWGIIGDLRRDGMLRVRKEGRRHHYSVNPEGYFRHPTIRNVRLGALLNGVPSAMTVVGDTA